jgi:Heterokaryon incompatibility protein (HET)
MWGVGPRYKTELNNVQKHQAYGGLEKVFPKLPRVITDAIKLVRGLGERYLWVDSLCIVQGSARSWKLNSAVMDLVYGHAHLTICAADGEGATTGLKGVTPAERQITQHVEECGPNVRLMVSHLAETYIKRSTWNTRAWTFQERLLSKRCLIFADGRVFFQCRSAAMSEDVNAEQKDAGWSIELVQAPLQMLHELDTRVFWVYMNCIRLYTARHLGRPKDVLAAFTGMSNLLGAKMGAPLVFGLPSAYFDLALLWEAQSGVTRRLPRSKEEEKDFDGAKFPSWSWCGWMGSTMTYNRSTIEACLPNVHEWLTEHTWISWYIRDGHGDLRPIWNSSIHTEGGQRVEGRWKGYGTTQPPETPCDPYGRSLQEEYEALDRSKFVRTLPEYPYRVSIASADVKRESQFSDQCFLQFWTWSAFLRLYPHRQPSHQTLGEGLWRYDIADYTRDWCGTIVLNRRWGDQWPVGKEHEFIAISAAKDFSAEENDVWTYYIPKEKGQSEWDLYYVLLIEHKGEIAHRVGLGKVFKEAFSNSCLPGREWKEIILA